MPCTAVNGALYFACSLWAAMLRANDTRIFKADGEWRSCSSSCGLLWVVIWTFCMWQMLITCACSRMTGRWSTAYCVCRRPCEPLGREPSWRFTGRREYGSGDSWWTSAAANDNPYIWHEDQDFWRKVWVLLNLSFHFSFTFICLDKFYTKFQRKS